MTAEDENETAGHLKKQGDQVKNGIV